MCKDCFDESEDRFALARPAKKIDFVYSVVVLFLNVANTFANFLESMAWLIHGHRVNEAKKVYLRDELIRDIEKMEKHNG
jgi:hypothetical protein